MRLPFLLPTGLWWPKVVAKTSITRTTAAGICTARFGNRSKSGRFEKRSYRNHTARGGFATTSSVVCPGAFSDRRNPKNRRHRGLRHAPSPVMPSWGRRPCLPMPWDASNRKAYCEATHYWADSSERRFVTPAKAGSRTYRKHWIPDSAGRTG